MNGWLPFLAAVFALLLLRGLEAARKSAKRSRRPGSHTATGRPDDASTHVGPSRALIGVAGLILLGGLYDGWPMEYFTLLRLVVTVTAGHTAYVAHRQGERIWVAALVVIGLLFNPIIPVYLDRAVWLFLDVLTASVLLASLIALRTPRSHAIGPDLRPRSVGQSRPADRSDASESKSTRQTGQAALKARLQEKHGKLEERRGRHSPAENIDDLIQEYNVPSDVIKAKTVGYVIALRMSGKDSDWNTEIDEEAQRRGFLTAEEIAAAQYNFEQAV